MQNHPAKDQHDQSYRIPILGENYYRNYGTNLDSVYINGYPEVFKNPVTGESRQVFVKRPGIQTSTTLTNSLHTDIFSGLGLTENNMKCVATKIISGLNDCLISVWIDWSTGTGYVCRSRPSNGSVSIRVGTIASLGGTATQASQDYFHIEECQIDNGGTTYVGLTVTRQRFDRTVSSGWWARAGATDFTAASLTQIVAAAYPDQAGRVTTGPLLQMNGLFHVMCTDGTVWTSGAATGVINDPTQWNSLTYVLTYQDPDSGIGLARYKNHILACSTNSIEFFNDVGNPAPASPLDRTEQALIRFGVAHPKAYMVVADTFYWQSAGERHGASLWKLDGYTPVKISTPREDRQLGFKNTNNITFSDNDMIAFVMNGQLHIGVNGVTTYPHVFTYTTQSTYYWGATTDTWYTKGATPSATHDFSKLRGSILCYNVEDKIWWSWMMYPGTGTGTNSANYIMRTAMSVRAETTSDWSNNFFQTYVFVAAVNSSPTQNIPNTTLLGISSNVTGAGLGYGPGGYYDSNPKQSTYADQPVTVIIGFQMVDFGNSERKKINSLSLQFASIPQQRATAAGHSTSVDSGSYSYTLGINKTNHMSSLALAPDINTNVYRVNKYPNMDSSGSSGSVNAYGLPDRFYFMNLGMARYWNFGVLCESKDPFPLEYLECDVMQGTH